MVFAAEVAAWPHTAICFISPHRGADELAALSATAGERPAVLARELTKAYETCHRDRLDRLATTLAAAPPKGEWTLVIGPKPAPADIDLTSIVAAALAAAEAGQSLKAACIELANRHGVPWRTVYKLALAAGKPLRQTFRPRGA
jgi:16S rRNA (cytidine1402-2'-O)-methyltransferase